MALVLRVCKSDFTSRDGFMWPSEVGAVVTAPDWDGRKVCGSGLHGWLHGQGDVTCVDHWQDAGAKWFVLEVETFIELDGKVKFPSAVVRFVGEKGDAAAYLLDHDPEACAVIGLSLDVGDNAVAVAGGLSTLTGGDGSTLTGGDGSTLTGGDGSTLTGGEDSTLTGGDGSTLTGGDDSTLTGGDRSTLTGGYRSTLTGGYRSTLTGGDDSTLTGGYGSTLTGGDDSTLTGGYGSTLTGGYGSTLTGGDGSTLTFTYWDERKRLVTAYTGEDGIKANTPYKLNDEHKPVEVTQ